MSTSFADVKLYEFDLSAKYFELQNFLIFFSPVTQVSSLKEHKIDNDVSQVLIS